MKQLTILLCTAVAALLWAASPCEAQEQPSGRTIEKHTFTGKTGLEIPYIVMYPEEYCSGHAASPIEHCGADCPGCSTDDGCASYPLVVFLHGAGERGSENGLQLKHGGEFFRDDALFRHCIILAPLCPCDSTWAPKNGMSNGDWTVFPEESTILQTLATVREIIDGIIATGIVDENRIYCTGLSMGGMGTFDFVLRFPDLFAAAAPICGGVNPLRFEHFTGRTAFRIFHGGADPTVNVQHSREAAKALVSGGHCVEYIEYPGVDHASWFNAWAEPDFSQWLLKHSK